MGTPKFSFSVPNQAEELRIFHTRAVDYLEALDIDPDSEDQNKHGWQQLKMMFQGEDRQTFKILLNNDTITPEDQLIPPVPSTPYSYPSKKMNIFGILEMTLWVTIVSSQMNTYTL